MLVKIAKASSLRAGDILFSKPKSSGLLRKITVEMPQGGDPLSHVAIVGPNRQFVVEASMTKGVNKIPLKKWVAKNTFDARRVQAPSTARRKAAKQAMAMVGKEYSLRAGARAIATPRAKPKNTKKIVKKIKNLPALFCSTLIVGSFDDVDFGINKHPSDILPVDLKRSPKLKKIS